MHFFTLLAQGTSGLRSNIASEISSTFTYKELGPFVSNLWGAAFVLGVVAAFLFVVIGAVLWITAGGDKGKTEQARERITQGLIGLTILAVSWAVALLVQQFLGLNILVGGGTGGGGSGPYPCTAAQQGLTWCRYQDCHLYTCNNLVWNDTGNIEPNCTPGVRCY